MSKIRPRDIPDETILGLVRDNSRNERKEATTWAIVDALPEFPPKVVAAKLGLMVRRGRLDGCSSGRLLSRGDFCIFSEIKDGDIMQYLDNGKGFSYPCYMRFAWPRLRRKLADMMQRGILMGKLRGSLLQAWVAYPGTKFPVEAGKGHEEHAKAFSDGIEKHLWDANHSASYAKLRNAIRKSWRP